jgi:hypothetical protein
MHFLKMPLNAMLIVRVDIAVFSGPCLARVIMPRWALSSLFEEVLSDEQFKVEEEDAKEFQDTSELVASLISIG